MSIANDVFNIPELLELIILALPTNNIYQELGSIRTIIFSQTTTRTWHALVQHSTPIRQRLYLPTTIDAQDSLTWSWKHPSPPAQPNPWVPSLLLHQRSWGSAYPFDDHHTSSSYTTLQPSPSQHWTFSFEISRLQHSRFPPPGPWRDMLISSPPFTHVWYTRSFYELGSGRAPFVTHLDYDPRKPKCRQKYAVHRPGGVTLGNVCDAARDLFALDDVSGGLAKYVMVESVKVLEEEGDLSEDRPTTRLFVPGMSAEEAHGWCRE